MTRASLCLIILAVAMVWWPGGAAAKSIYLTAGEGEDLSSAVAGASAGDIITLRGGSGIATYPVRATINIRKNIQIHGQAGYLPVAIEIVGQGEGEGGCSTVLKNMTLDEPGEPDWSQNPANQVIVGEGEAVYVPCEGEGEGEGESASPHTPPYMARFAAVAPCGTQPLAATAVSQQIGAAPAAAAPGPFVYELRYLVPILPVPDDGRVAEMKFKLKIVNGTAADKLEVLGEGTLLETFQGNETGYASYSDIPKISMLCPAEGEGEGESADCKRGWTYLWLRASIANSSTRFYVDDVRVGDKPILGGGFEDEPEGEYSNNQDLWLQTTVGDPILIHASQSELAAEGEWAARFGQDPSIATPTGMRQFLRFFYRVDESEAEGEPGDILGAQVSGATLNNAVQLRARGTTPQWRSVVREIVAETEGEPTLAFSTSVEGEAGGVFSIDHVYVGGATSEGEENRVANPDFEVDPAVPWTPLSAAVYSPAESSGYELSHGFARIGSGVVRSSRDVSMLEQNVDIPDNVHNLDFYLRIARPDTRRLNQFEVRVLDGTGDHVLFVAHDQTTGFSDWRKVRVNVRPFRAAGTVKLRFIGRVHADSPSAFFVDTLCLPEEQPLDKPIFDVASESEGETVQLTLWNLSVRSGTSDILVRNLGQLIARRCGIFDATSYGVQVVSGGGAILANCSISNNASNAVHVATNAKSVTLLECTLYRNGGAGVFAAGDKVDSYACLLYGNGSTFKELGGKIGSHHDWVPGGEGEADYGDAATDPPPVKLKGEVLNTTPPFANASGSPVDWPGNLDDRQPWPQSDLDARTIGIGSSFITRDFENDPRATENVRVGADVPEVTGGAYDSGCDVDAEFAGLGSQITITTYGSDAGSFQVYVVPQDLLSEFNPVNPVDGTYILLDAPESISPDGNAEFVFTMPYVHNSAPATGLWMDGAHCMEGRAWIFVKHPSEIMERNCSFVIDTIAPLLAEDEKDKTGRELVTDHNDTCLPNMPLMLGWRPGVEPMPFTDGTWRTAGPQVFLNVNSQSAYVACAEGEIALSFQTELSFFDPYPVDANGNAVAVEVAGFNDCVDCTSDDEPGIPVWAEGIPASDWVDLTSATGVTVDGYPAVTGTWTVLDAPFEASSWYPREARFMAVDNAGNASDKTPPLMLWWMQNAEITVSGPGDPKDPVFTWRFVRPANPENAAPCQPIFRYVIVPLLGDATGSTWTSPDTSTLDWTTGSDWLSTAEYGYRITRTTLYKAGTTFADAIADAMTRFADAGYFALYIQAVDEAGNVSEPVSEEIVNATTNEVTGTPRWPLPVGSGYKLTTRVSARFWHNVSPPAGNLVWDLGEPDFGGATRIPLPTVAGQRIEAQFTVAMGYPDTILPSLVKGEWELYRDGERILRSTPDNVYTADPSMTLLTLPADLPNLDFSLNQGKDVNYLFKVFTFIDDNGSDVWDEGEREPRDPEGASVRFTVVSGRPVLDTQPIKLIVKGE